MIFKVSIQMKLYQMKMIMLTFVNAKNKLFYILRLFAINFSQINKC